eukprot:g12497.t2
MSSSDARGREQWGRLGGGQRAGKRALERTTRRQRISADPSRPSLIKPRGLLASVLSLAVVGRVTGWKDCVVSPEDEWKPASGRTPAMRMRFDYERRYTCESTKASFVAASFYFDSPCMPKRFFHPPEVHSCLRGRRVIFLGDSLSNQQGDSMLGMLGWHPSWLTKGDPRNSKKALNPDGTKHYTLVDCWHPEEGGTGWVERCFDYSTKDFQPLDVPKESSIERSATGKQRALAGNGGDGGGEGRDEDEISVHMRMYSKPHGTDWFNKAVRDYNETRPSDVFVVNFGGHYHFTPEEDERFKADMSPILDSMAELGEKATVVWREISPTHFPAQNGSYDAYMELDPVEREKSSCCTGTPPRVLDRNVWVENYLRNNGLADRVKLLRIYDMSWARGAAHHTCHFAPGYAIDCVHWSEPGVVEEWNALLLNHICDTPGVA